MPSLIHYPNGRLADRDENEMTPQEFMDMFEVRLNILEEARRIEAVNARIVKAMSDAYSAGQS